MSKGTKYEILSKEIYETILSQSDLKNIEVKHNIILSGITTDHQIDVYWEFELNEILYKTIVQTKDWNKPIDQGELLKFSAILKDIPGQPRGIFIASNGYQKGAIEFANANGIDIMILEESISDQLSLVEYGYAELKYKKEQIPIIGKNTKESIRIIECTPYEPIIERYEIGFDFDWLFQNTGKLELEIRNTLSKYEFPKFTPNDLIFYNDSESQIGYFGEIYKIYLETLRKNNEYQGRLEHIFVSPTFIELDIFDLKFIKILSVSTNITVAIGPVKYINFKLPNLVQFVLKNIKSNSSIFIGKSK